MGVVAKPVRALLAGGIAAACTVTCLPAEASAEITAPGGGSIHALVVGIDEYWPKQPLKGAAADATDIEESLEKAGVPKENITFILNKKATRANVLEAMKNLAAHSQKGDLAILTFAGHGGRIKEMYANTKPDHMDEAYILWQYNDTVTAGASELIAGPEIKHWIAELDAKGVDILFVADTCHGGGLTRAPQRTDVTVSYRHISVSGYAKAEANAYSSAADAARPATTFPHLTFLAAVDAYHKAPEVAIAGYPTLRGALSYAVARAIEGKSGRADHGLLTRGALFGYARQEVLHHSDAQVIETQPIQQEHLDTPVFRSAEAPAERQLPENVLPKLEPLKIAIENGDAGALNAAKRVFDFVTVTDKQDADLIWDGAKHEVFSAGGAVDSLARDIAAADVPGVVDRLAASRLLARLSDSRTQDFRLLPDNSLHHLKEKLSLEAPGVEGKYLIAFNITGDGIVQNLFPQPSDQPQVGGSDWRIGGIEVTDHFGSDLVVVIVSPTRLTGLEKDLKSLDNTRNAGVIPEILNRYLDAGHQVRIGLTTVVTAP
jgi:hypothetical protein